MPFPTEDQTRVINHRGRPLVVVAGPGTGKTRTLVERMIELLRSSASGDGLLRNSKIISSAL
jgi:superfamily I DNA/RNA helicase